MILLNRVILVGRNKCSLFRVLPRHLFPMHPSGALVKTQIKWLARSRILKRCGDLIHSDRFQDLTVTSFYRGSGTTDLTEGSGFGLRVSRPALFRRTTISESNKVAKRAGTQGGDCAGVQRADILPR